MVNDYYLKKELYELLKKDESMFNFFQESCFDGLWYWDLERPENEWMSERFWKVLGYDPLKMPQSPNAWQGIINQEDLKVALENCRKHLENENHPYDQTVRYTHKNGNTVWVRCNGKAIRDQNGKPIRMLGVHTLIVDQGKNIELLNRKNTILDIVNKLQQTFLTETTSNEVFENALKMLLNVTESEYGFIGEVLQNADGQPFLKTKSITNIAWNEATRKFYEENAPRGLEFTNLNTLFGVVLKTGKAIIANQPSTHPQRGGLPEGHPPLNAFLGLPLLVGTKMVGMAGVSNRIGGYEENLIAEIEPITTTLGRLIEAQQAKLALQKSEERYRGYIDNAPDGIFIVDSTGRYLEVNEAGCAQTGYSKEEILKMSISDFLTEESKETGLRHFALVSEFGRSDAEVLFRRKDGSKRWWSLTAVKLSSDRYLGFTKEITDAKHIAESLISAKEEAENANKAKSEFLANMSHEIRTPLNAVIGFTELLRNTPLSNLQQQYIDIANTSGHTLLGIINSILDFSKIEAGVLQLETIKTDFIELAEQCVDIVKYSALKKNLKLHLDIQPGLPRLGMTDPIRLKQVITNLLSNAIKFTNAGEVDFNISYKRISKSKVCYYFSIRDTGIGISEDQKSKLFKAFSQADNSITRKFGGTGLGLVISELILNKLDSKIYFDSKQGEGSTFYFDLVVNWEEGDNWDNTSNSVIGKNIEIKFLDKDPFVLIVDDEPINVYLLKSIISKLVPSAKFEEASTGHEALEKYVETQPDIIFMDIQMPEKDGLDATREIRKMEKNSGKEIPIIAFTAGAFKEDEEKCISAGMTYFLPKPAKIESIAFVIRQYLFLNEITPSSN